MKMFKLCFQSYLFFRKYSTDQIKFTSQIYPNLIRGSYSKLQDKDILFFQNLLGASKVVTNPEELVSSNIDWLKTFRGKSKLKLLPSSTDQVSQILSYCNDKNIAVCPQGGNTGLVGGSVPVFDEVILSTQALNKVLSFDSLTGVIQCEAGCVLESLEKLVNEKNFVVPLDLGAKGSCHIGGNVATNAGGIRLLRYGSLLGNILGIEVVIASGQVLNFMSTLRKDNTGFNLKQLFIGSEGVLGVITKVSLLCYPKPKSTAVAFIGCNSFEDLLKCLQSCKLILAENLQSFEMLDHEALKSVIENLHLNNPISNYPFYIVLETAGSSQIYIEEQLVNCLGILSEDGIIQDCTFTSDTKRMLNLWALRERITEALSKDGYVYKYDLSLPHQNFYQIVEEMREKLSDTSVTRCCGYGHLGDGNVHLNITSPAYDSQIMGIIEPFVYKWTSSKSGSISAEHGLGFKKKNYIYYNKSKEVVEYMKNCKELFDPNQILNPYKVLPSF